MAAVRQDVRSLQIKLQMLKRAHGIDDEAYRDRLELVTGQRSSKGLGARELAAVLQSYAAQDVHPPVAPGARKPRPTPARQALVGKIEALLAEKGKVEGSYVPWSYAEGILKRQSGLAKLEWATPAQLAGVVTALVNDARRKGRTLG